MYHGDAPGTLKNFRAAGGRSESALGNIKSTFYFACYSPLHLAVWRSKGRPALILGRARAGIGANPCTLLIVIQDTYWSVSVIQC